VNLDAQRNCTRSIDMKRYATVVTLAFLIAL
jgi:hypothetical protein